MDVNLTRLDRLSCGLAATVMIVGFGGAAQAETVTSAAALLEDSSSGAIVAQSSQPTPLEAPNQLPPPGEPVPDQPSEPSRTADPSSQPIPPADSTPGTFSTPLESPNQLPPGGIPGSGQPSDPTLTVPPTTQTTPPPTTRPAPPPRPRESVVRPGRTTRSGSSYVGLGGNIGLGDGSTALGDGSFAIFSKIGLTNLLSVRPSVLLSDDATILVPVTIDFIPGITRVTEDVTEEVGLRASPFAGAGVAVSTGDEGSVDLLLTGGVDVPIARRFTATAQVNVTVFDDPAAGLMLGLGYNF